jgi:hypothetical protein
VLRALVIAALLAAAPKGDAPTATRSTPAAARGAASRCDKIYARPFTVTRGASKVQLRVMRMPAPGNPVPPTSQAVFEVPFPVCRGLGEGWRVAAGSFAAGFLREMKASDSPPLKAALDACPVTYHRVDTVCAPCVAGSHHCPCADRDIADWIFCEKP